MTISNSQKYDPASKKTVNKHTENFMVSKVYLEINQILFAVLCAFLYLIFGCRSNVADSSRLECNIVVTDSLGTIVGTDDVTDWQPRMQTGPGFPAPFSVRPAFPNPAGTTTSTFLGNTPRIGCAITYSLPSLMRQVKVTVNDTLRTLVEEAAQAGMFMVIWDLKDDFSEPVPNGCYEVRITAANDDTTYQSTGDIKIER